MVNSQEFIGFYHLALLEKEQLQDKQERIHDHKLVSKLIKTIKQQLIIILKTRLRHWWRTLLFAKTSIVVSL